MRTVDAIVPVFGHWEMVQRCVASLLAQHVPVHVIVVDDRSPDDVADRVATAFPDVELVRQPVNSGFAAACNAGFARGTGEVAILVNSDVEADSGMVGALLPAFDDEAVASASPAILQPDGRLDAVGITADPTLAGFVRYHGGSIAAAGRTAPRLLGPYGAVAAYRRAAVPDGTLFDEGIFMYGEELDLALRLSAAGHRSVVVPAARAMHLGGATTGRGSSRQLYLAGYGRGYILGKYRVIGSRQGLRALVTELVVVAQRLMRSGDPAALKGRVEGYLAGRRQPPARRPTVGLEHRIGFLESLRMRSARYWSRY